MNPELTKFINENKEKIEGPFSFLTEEVSKSTNDILGNNVYIDINGEIVELDSIKKELLDFMKLSYEIQEKYSITNGLLKTSEKGDEKDIVTQADKEIEKIFREKYANLIPQYTIAGEEEAIDVHNKNKIVLIDPIDGTKWFVKGVAKYGTILGIYRNGYNILSVVLNTKKRRVYVADLKGVELYNIIKQNGENIIIKDENNSLDLEDKNKIFLHLNFKGENAIKNDEIKNKIEKGLNEFNKKNNTNYEIAFMQTAPDIGAKIARNEATGFVHYGPAPHDIAGNLVYLIHNPNLIFTDHNGKKYNYFDHNDLIESYKKYNEKKDSDGKKYLYKYPFIMTKDKKLYKFLMDILKDYKDLFDLKANPKFT